MIGIVITLVGINRVYSLYSENKSLQSELFSKRQRAKSVKKYNQKITAKVNAEQLYVVTQNTINQSTKFYDLFLNWSSWGQYSDHLSVIKNKFPVISEERIVDTSSFTVGSGSSGTSTYEVDDTYISPTKGSIVQLVTQTRQFDTTSATIQWFVTSRMVGKNQLEITSMKAIRSDK